jgi:hypothetical protein
VLTKRPWFRARLGVPGFARPFTWQGRIVALGMIGLLVLDIRVIGLGSPAGIAVLAIVLVASAITVLTSTELWSWGLLRRK